MRNVAESARYSIACYALLLASCIGGQTGTPTRNHSGDPVSPECDATADSPTALGLRGVDLYELYAGSYVFDARVSSRDLDFRGKPVRFTIDVAPTDEPVSGVTACNAVAVPVEIAIDSDDDELRGTVYGTLRWEHFIVSIEIDDREPAGDDPRVSGAIYPERPAKLSLLWVRAGATTRIEAGWTP